MALTHDDSRGKRVLVTGALGSSAARSRAGCATPVARPSSTTTSRTARAATSPSSRAASSWSSATYSTNGSSPTASAPTCQVRDPPRQRHLRAELVRRAQAVLSRQRRGHAQRPHGGEDVRHPPRPLLLHDGGVRRGQRLAPRGPPLRAAQHLRRQQARRRQAFVHVLLMQNAIPAAVTARIFNCYGPRATQPYVIPERRRSSPSRRAADGGARVSLGSLEARR